MKKKGAIAIVAILAVLAAIIFVRAQDTDRLYAPERKDWKKRAIADIGPWSTNSTWLVAERQTAKTRIADERDDRWFSDYLILMKNGDWIVYRSICSKQDRRVHDIFIGRASDGKWYYSTYHFCINMLTLRIMDQSEGLPDFIKAYYLREFDGRSDECLQKTWPVKKQQSRSP